jgi:hypothetical protein
VHPLLPVQAGSGDGDRKLRNCRCKNERKITAGQPLPPRSRRWAASEATASSAPGSSNTLPQRSTASGSTLASLVALSIGLANAASAQVPVQPVHVVFALIGMHCLPRPPHGPTGLRSVRQIPIGSAWPISAGSAWPIPRPPPRPIRNHQRTSILRHSRTWSRGRRAIGFVAREIAATLRRESRDPSASAEALPATLLTPLISRRPSETVLE